MTNQDKVKKLYIAREYTSDLKTLALGLCEEAGEVAKAINTFHNSEYKPSSHNQSGSVEHELCDVLVYLYEIANVLGIDIDKKLEESLS